MLKAHSKAKKIAHNKSLSVRQDTAPDLVAHSKDIKTLVQSRAPTSQPALKTNRKLFKHLKMKLKRPKRIKENYLARRTSSKKHKNLILKKEERPEV